MKIQKLSRKGFNILCATVPDFECAVNCYGDRTWEDPKAKARAILALTEDQTVTVKVSQPDRYYEIGGGFGRFTADVSAWFQPYFSELEKRTGSAPFDLDLTSAARRITHTHCTERIWCKGDSTWATQVLKVYGFSGDKEISPERFQELGRNRMAEFIGGEFGKSYTPPEFQDLGNGLFRKAQGLRKTTYTPNPYNGEVWQLIFAAWLEQFGTKGQKEFIARFARVHNSKELFPSLRDSHRDQIHLDNYHASITWEQFRNA